MTSQDPLNKPFTIAQITDAHVGREIPFQRGLLDLCQQLESTVNHLNRLDPKPELLVFTGDIVNHGKSEDYQRVKTLLTELQMPCYLAVDNHDHRGRLQTVFSSHHYLHQMDGFIQYVIEDHPIRIVVLDTLAPGSHHGHLCRRRLEWLDSTLRAAPQVPTIIFMHHPPFVTGMPYPDRLGLDNHQPLADIITTHPQVEAVASGHTHREATLRWQGSVAYITPSCAFSYGLEFNPVDDLDPLLEPPACRLFRWTPGVGLVSHLSYIGSYDLGLTEGFPPPPSA
ncbi:MAG: phosphodiesterase [Arenicellales bacterium]|jgi:3',5'-cyclic AMP phosphodiesterase CpdA|nr:phosphodiesterase [Arenicellales bacterium]MDP7282817.1 phosphodiesterase [Arenicellales bacterium]MDP7482331.1 phosphodiesterase [Arenicellales bacterium]